MINLNALTGAEPHQLDAALTALDEALEGLLVRARKTMRGMLEEERAEDARKLGTAS